MPQILIVDDSRYSRHVLGETLRIAGYEVIEAADGQSGLALASEHTPDCVLVDLEMPRLDGQAFLRQAQRMGLDMPVIVTSADAAPAVRRDCETLGARGLLAKPIEPDALIDAVEQALVSIEDAFPNSFGA
jgi:two-component system chemotaxis response regulator CheY